MKQGELRIGNLVNFKIHTHDKGYIDPPLVVSWHDLKWITDNKEHFNDHIKPIPLTEAWLKKLGFEKDDGNYFINIGKNYQVNMRIAVDFDVEEPTVYIWLYESPDNSEWQNQTHIKHVHQIQNLYHALTGKELILQEETIDAKR